MPAPSDLVHQTTTGTGAGNLTLAAVNGKRSFNTAFGNGATTNVFDYFISSRDATEWERGTGHMSDATTLVRDTVIASSNSNSVVTFSAGTKDITNDVPAGSQYYPGVTSLEIGHATDTTLSRASAGDLAVEGNRIFRVGGTDVPVADGGTGGSTAADARTNLGFTSALVDRGYGEYTTNADLTTLIPIDDTIPQVTEGTQIISVAITPKATTNRIRARFSGNGVCGSGDGITVAMFRNGGANAITSNVNSVAASNIIMLSAEFEDSPGSTSLQTYTVRVGASAATIRMNGTMAGRLYGGSSRATLVLEELTA